jgi:UDP-N-acetylmuramoyl-L-alanyl-D-glutamate--2,6-diaminopimelate ligase
MVENSLIQKFKNFVHKKQYQLASKKYNFPQRKLVIIGITGTDGKTTVTSMVYHILKSAGLLVGYISTVRAKAGDKEIDTGFHVTTPDPWEVPKYLQMMVDEGIKFVVLESTSMGLQQNRLYDIKFDSAIITNIKKDHLDYHGSWENYANAKFKLVEMIKNQGLLVLNKDDEQSASWITKKSSLLTHDVYVKWSSIHDLKNLKQDIDGLHFNYLDKDFSVPIIGEYNFLNLLQAINLTLRYTDIEKISESLRTYDPPEGRMQIIQKSPFAVIVDFAHTPNALMGALESLARLVRGKGRIITVFGCAGKRDKGRRHMGEVSAELSDLTILAPEDPRNETVYDINTQIIAQARKSGASVVARFKDTDHFRSYNLEELRKQIEEVIRSGQKPFIAFDQNTPLARRDAIDLAISLAKKDDIVLITGKGHERTLAFGEKETEYPWSDEDVAKKFLITKNAT